MLEAASPPNKIAFRPISLYPFPEKRLSELASRAQGFLVVEMNAGQMVEDVELAVCGKAPVRFYGRMGGVVPLPEEVLIAIHELARRVRQINAEAEVYEEVVCEGRCE